MKSRLSMMLVSIALLAGCAETSLDAESSYESVVKDDAFRASIELPPVLRLSSSNRALPITRPRISIPAMTRSSRPRFFRSILYLGADI